MKTGTQSSMHGGRDLDSGYVVAAVAPRVLVCDDDAEMREVLAWTLETEGFEVTIATSGPELLARVAINANQGNARYDLIVCDIRMPGLSGLKMLELQSGSDVYPATILITAFGDAQTHHEASRLGAAAVIDKPFYLTDFMKTVRTVVHPIGTAS